MFTVCCVDFICWTSRHYLVMFPRVIVVYPDEESEMSRDLLRGKYVMIIAP